jgi:hypothetical protein
MKDERDGGMLRRDHLFHNFRGDLRAVRDASHKNATRE